MVDNGIRHGGTIAVGGINNMPQKEDSVKVTLVIKKDSDIFRHLEKQDGFTNYVKELIAKDMEKNGKSNEGK